MTYRKFSKIAYSFLTFKTLKMQHQLVFWGTANIVALTVFMQHQKSSLKVGVYLILVVCGCYMCKHGHIQVLC